MTDLVCVVADKKIRAAVSGLLERPSAPGIRPITSEMLLHPEHDPGCFHRPADLCEAPTYSKTSSDGNEGVS